MAKRTLTALYKGSVSFSAASVKRNVDLFHLKRTTEDGKRVSTATGTRLEKPEPPFMRCNFNFDSSGALEWQLKPVKAPSLTPLFNVVLTGQVCLTLERDRGL